MRLSTFNAFLALCGVIAHTPDAFATSGWDAHSVDIEDRFRVQGANGSSFVYRLDNRRATIDPALISTTNHPGIHGPPEFLVTTSHIVLRYKSHLPRSVDDPQKHLYFAVRKHDSLITGPLSDDAFSNSSFSLGESVHWTSPSTPSDSLTRIQVVFFSLVTSVALVLIILVVRFIHRRLQPKMRIQPRY